MAATIIDDWASVKPEPTPSLKPVIIEAKDTALAVAWLLSHAPGVAGQVTLTAVDMTKF